MKKYILFILLFLNFFFAKSQSDFEIPDTVCVGEKLEITYLGNGGESFCLVPDANIFSFGLTADLVQNFTNGNLPLFSDVVQDGDDFYVFTTISINGSLVRLDFGNSLSNIPTSTTFQLDSLPAGQEGIQILNDNGHWWGFIIGGNIDFFGPEYFVRLDFGNSITNEPTLENLGNIGNLYFPHDLFITKENEEWIGFTINKLGSSITRFYFGNSLGNTPTAVNLGNVGNIFRPTGFFPIQIGGEWHFFIANAINSTFSRVDFGNSLFNIPSGVNMGNLGILDRPRDVLIIEGCENYFGLVLNRMESEIIILDFSNDIQNTPVASSFGNFGDFSYPHSVTETHITEEGITLFIVYVETGELVQVTFEFPLGFFIDCKSSIEDFDIIYPSAGNYTLQLIVDEGLPTQSSFCKDIVVIPSPDLDLGKDTTTCFNTTVTLESNFPNTIWQNQEEGIDFDAIQAGIYVGEVTVGNCTTRDSVEVIFEDCESCFKFPNAFTPNGDLVNDEFKPATICDSQTSNFTLEVFNRWGQKVFQTNNPMEGWNGKFNGKSSPSDVYVWKLIYIYSANSQMLEKVEFGDVTLIY